MSAAQVTLPPLTEVFPKRQLGERHQNLLPQSRIDWAVRNRRTNGLSAAGAIFESPCGEILIHEPTFLRWFLGLTGRAKPRTTRRPRGASASAQA